MINRIATPDEAAEIARNPNSTPEEIQEALDWLTTRVTSAEKAVADAQEALDTELSRLSTLTDALAEATFVPPVVYAITRIDAAPMSTIWSFTAKSTDGQTVVFHADHRPGRNLCEGLADQALAEAEVDVPSDLPRGVLVAAMDVELVPDETMGMSMPSVMPIGLNHDRLNTLIAKFLNGGR